MQRLSETIKAVRPRRRGAAAHAPTNRTGRAAFTLVELLAVMLILAILVGLVVGVTRHVTARANYERTIVTMQIVNEAIDAYRDDPGTTGDPGTLADLTSNVAAKKVLANLDSETWNQGSTINDAYGNALIYEKTGGLGGCPVVISGGPDGDTNTEDDNIRSDK